VSDNLYYAFASSRVGVRRRNKMQATNEKSFSTASQSNTKNLVETLPTREGWSSPLVLYNNCWIRSSMLPSAISLTLVAPMLSWRHIQSAVPPGCRPLHSPSPTVQHTHFRTIHCTRRTRRSLYDLSESR
jgi:hypothetical protein